MLANQNKALFYYFNQLEESIVYQNKAKFRKFLWKHVLGTAVKLNIFSKSQLIKRNLAAILMDIWNNRPEKMKFAALLILKFLRKTSVEGHKRPYLSNKRVYNFWKLWDIYQK